MDKDPKDQQGEEISNNEEELMDRRGFLLGLKKWSKIVIGGVLLGSGLLNAGTKKEAEAGAWVNRHHGGGAWANRHGGGGVAWANRGGAWGNRGGSWINRF